jgi:membrane protein implicated in regulation of membrane protease activity
MGLFGDLLDFIGLGGITGIDILFAVMAIIGTVLFLIYFLLVMLFGFADDMLPFDMDMSADGIFHLFTIQGILSFMMMFGIFGLAMTQADQHSLIAIIVGVIAGTVSMYIVGKIFQMMKSLEMDNTIKYSEAIGAKGTVYRTINAGEHGQVQVEYQGALRTSDAVAQDDKLTIQTGKFIKVIDAIGETLIVEPLDISSNSEE